MKSSTSQIEVSVITPTYYRNELLERAIESVQGQTIKNTEHIVIDGSEEEYTLPVVEKYDNITYLSPVPDPGLNKSRELGVKQASGDYIQFLDDDDQLKSIKLEKSIERFDEDVGVVYCGFEGIETGEIELPDADARGEVLNQALSLNMFPAVPSTWTVRKSILEDIMPFEHPDGADDEGMHIEMAQRTQYDYVDEPLVIFGQDSDQSFSETWEYVDGLSYLLTKYNKMYTTAPDGIHEYALEKVHRKRAKMYLRDYVWTPKATVEFSSAAYHSPDRTFKFGCVALASLFGRPGITVSQSALQYLK